MPGETSVETVWTALSFIGRIRVEAQVLAAGDGGEAQQACQGLEAVGAGEMGALRGEHGHVALGLLQRALLRLHADLEAARVVLDGVEREGGRERRQHQGPVDPAKHHGFPSPASWSQAGASVRTAALSLAERDRGLAATSLSVGLTGRWLRNRKLGAGRAPVCGGRWREPRSSGVARSLRKRLTSRSSSEWKVTTTRRPPGASTRSAAARPRPSSESSSLT